MDRGSLLVRSGDCIHSWRTRLVDAFDNSGAPGKDIGTTDVVRIIKFYTLLESSEENGCDDTDESFGYTTSPLDVAFRPHPMPAVQDLITIIITTSPIKSNPSTELLERAMDTFIHGGPDFAFKCRKVIVCGTSGH
jgi:hypothetical protein